MLKYEKVKQMFKEEGLVLSKNEYSGGYSSARDTGGGAVDENSIITPHKDLTTAEQWLHDKIEFDREVENFNRTIQEAYLGE